MFIEGNVAGSTAASDDAGALDAARVELKKAPVSAPAKRGEAIAREIERIQRWMHAMAKEGTAPTRKDFCSATGVALWTIKRRFGTYTDLARQCGYSTTEDRRRTPKRARVCEAKGGGGARSGAVRVHRKRRIESFFGEPLDGYAMSNAPTNEQGVVMLFGMMARELGFEIELVRTGYPDCEAKREGPDGKWRRVRIEFEYATSRFAHDPAGCDLIVCWEVDSKSAAVRTLEILELKKVIEDRKAALAKGKTAERES